jgi:hypothetical protein
MCLLTLCFKGMVKDEKVMFVCWLDYTATKNDYIAFQSNSTISENIHSLHDSVGYIKYLLLVYALQLVDLFSNKHTKCFFKYYD